MTDLEQQRILNAYEARASRDHEKRAFFGLESLDHDARLHQRFRETRLLLRMRGLSTLHGQHILDIGCGEGRMLRQFVQWGAEPARLKGIELRSGPVETAKNLSPNIDIRVGSAAALPWPESSFDLVCQHTVFTSILDPEMKRTVANEMQRVLRPGGVILWYDFAFNNPRNPDVRGVKRAEIITLFPDMNIHLKRITLAPPIARRIPEKLIPVVYPLLSSLPFLRTHLLGVFVKER